MSLLLVIPKSRATSLVSEPSLSGLVADCPYCIIFKHCAFIPPGYSVVAYTLTGCSSNLGGFIIRITTKGNHVLIALKPAQNKSPLGQVAEHSGDLVQLFLRTGLFIDPSTNRMTGRRLDYVSHTEDIDVVLQTIAQHLLGSLGVRVYATEMDVAKENGLRVVFALLDFQILDIQLFHSYPLLKL